MMRRLVDRLFGLIAIALARLFHRRMAFENLAPLRARGPRVIVVNHFNGFVDVVVIIAALGRLPRFVGKATLRKVVVIRPFLRLAGVVLVQRAVDGEGTGANMSAFGQCHERLRRGETIVIFPEGTTHDREALAPIRTGAARIALGAVAAGVPDLVIVPVGLTYGDKTRLRNDVLVSGGEPIAVGGGGEDDHDAVLALTEALTDELEDLVPGLDDPVEAWALERAAAVADRDHDHEPDLADRRGTARQVARAPAPVRASVASAVSDYTLALDVFGVDDAAVVGSERPGLLEVAIRGVATWLLLPLIVAVALLNAPAIVLIVLIDRFVRVPVTKGTVRALVAVVLFPATWITFAVVTTDGTLAVTVVAIGQAIALLLVLWLVEGDVALAIRWWRHHRARVAAARLPALRARRERVVEAVTAALPPTSR
jgi:1-acyl-sn-glycerol-3-phosphate acyltransferase